MADPAKPWDPWRWFDRAVIALLIAVGAASLTIVLAVWLLGPTNTE